MRSLVALVVLALAACTPAPTPTAAEPTPAVTTAPVDAPTSAAPERAADEATCISKGGKWKPVCRMQQPACVTSFPDAGKTCSDGKDCAGDCLAKADGGFAPGGTAATGVCAADDDPCGCKQVIEGGKAGAALCAD
jgi:hypothetical protein